MITFKKKIYPLICFVILVFVLTIGVNAATLLEQKPESSRLYLYVQSTF